MVMLGCSFVLDTNDLHKGGAAGTTQAGTGGAAGASAADAAMDAPVCTFPDRDTCSDCLGMHCCSEINACTHDTTCNIAYVDFQQCKRAAKNAAAAAICTQAYRTRGGTPAAGLLGCTLTNCSTVCGT
jgi:hypothetical protein